MKRIWVFMLAAAALALAGCSPSGQETHPEWDDSWVRIADYVAVEPLDGFELNESNDLLSVSGLYYATWTCGPGQDFVNADGEDAVAYGGQIYVLLAECRSTETARAEVDTWLAREQQSYGTGEPGTKSFAGQSFNLLPLVSGREGNPYTHGAAAFAVRGKWAVSVELLCMDGFDGEPQDILERFLDGFHYAE